MKYLHRLTIQQGKALYCAACDTTKLKAEDFTRGNGICAACTERQELRPLTPVVAMLGLWT